MTSLRSSVLLVAAFSLATPGQSVSAAASRPAAPHPLDALTNAEAAAARESLKTAGLLDDGAAVVTLELHEPEKAALEAFAAGGAAPARAAFAVLYSRRENATVEAWIDVSARRVLRTRPRPGAQPMMHDADFALTTEAVRRDPRFVAAMARRGVAPADFPKINLDPWRPGERPVAGAEGSRLLRFIPFWKGDGRNEYGAPIEGVIVVVDVTRGAVVDVTDTAVAPLPPTTSDWNDPAWRGPERAPPKPLLTTQPEGPSFVIEGAEVRWQNWRLRLGWTPREGLVLHQVGYDDRGRTRSILHRASLAEMWVPYGHPDPNWSWRNAFDEGEYGFGKNATTLEAGRTAPAHAALLDAPGGARARPKIAIHERDGGVLWHHAGGGTRRARELVVGFFTGLGNYDYGFDWVFHQDGRLSFEAKLTGVVLARGTTATSCGLCAPDGAASRAGAFAADELHGAIVAENILGVLHQHLFCMRLDFDVDGRDNVVREHLILPAEEGAAGPDGNAFVRRVRELSTEKAARLAADPLRHRTVEVANTTPAARTKLGHAPGYVLASASPVVPFAHPSNAARRIAEFVEHAFFATRMKAEERYAAGDYPDQGAVKGGVLTFGEDDEPLTGDVVLWHTFGATHVPRPEEWPVMPAATCGFALVPHGFFDRNPALDL